MTVSYALKNGSRIVLVPMQETKAFTVQVLLPVGSRHESRVMNGGSHFLEHMMFKGTKRRPNTQIISRALDAIGAEYNAFTGKDHTGYYIKAAAEHAELLLDMLSDMLYHSIFDPKEFERERTVIIEEIHMYEDNPMMFVDELFEQELFRGNTLGWRISGAREDIEKMKLADVATYRKKHYRPSGLVIALAGKIPENARDLVSRYFDATKEPSITKPKPFATFHAASMSKGPKAVHHYKETEQVQCMLGFPGYGYGDKRLAAQSVLSVILGGNMSSRLFTQVRERRGLAYMVRAGVSPYQDIGAFAVQAGLRKDKVDEALKIILSELKKTKDVVVGAAELRRAKEYIKGKITLGLEESNEVADFYGRQELFQKKMESPEEKIAKIMAVTAKDVQTAARDIFRVERLRLAVIGPFEDAARFQKLLRV
ncbi:MAG: pitrilysin family protein [Patescibacteria group bacterium]